MPTNGYHDEAMKIGARSFTRSQLFKLGLWAWFLASITLDAGIARLFE
jgi:hypothetical protein